MLRILDLFTGYLSGNRELSATDVDEAIDLFVEDYPIGERRHILRDFEVLDSLHLDDRQLRVFLECAGCQFFPKEPAGVWLSDLRARLFVAFNAAVHEGQGEGNVSLWERSSPMLSLQRFLAGYFHQDWDLDFPDTKGGVDYFMNDATRDRAVAVRAGLDGLLAMELANEQYLQFLDVVGCCYWPGDAAEEWIRELRDRFAWNLDQQGPTQGS